MEVEGIPSAKFSNPTAWHRMILMSVTCLSIPLTNNLNSRRNVCCIDYYIITRQSHRKLIRNFTVHLQSHADSDHNIVCARVRIPGRFARNRKQRAPIGRKSIDRRAITSDTDRRERLIQLVAIQLTQTELGGFGGTVGEKAALFTDTLLQSAEEVMPGQIRQSRISGLLEDEAMHDEFEEAWTEREEARKAVHRPLAGGSAFRALRKACKKLREIIQAAEDRYLEVFACELEEFIVAGDLRGWHGHLKGGWKLQGKKLRSAQYIRDENGKLLRKLDEIRARWRRYFTSLLNTTSATLNRTIIQGLSQKSTALSLGDPPAVSETKKALRSMANGKAMGPDELPTELLKLGLSDSSHEILLAFHDIIVAVWMTGEVPQEWKDATIKVLHKKKDRTECSKASLWWRMLARFSSKSWPTDLATSTKKLGSSPKNSAASDPSARQPI